MCHAGPSQESSDVRRAWRGGAVEGADQATHWPQQSTGTRKLGASVDRLSRNACRSQLQTAADDVAVTTSWRGCVTFCCSWRTGMDSSASPDRSCHWMPAAGGVFRRHDRFNWITVWDIWISWRMLCILFVCPTSMTGSFWHPPTLSNKSLCNKNRGACCNV